MKTEVQLSQLLHEQLQRFWGYSEFREDQEAIITSVINGKDASSDDLRHVSSGIDGHDKKTGEECGQVNSVNHGYSIEDYHGLDDHGRTPENFYVGQ